MENLTTIIENVKNNIDFIEFHKDLVFNDFGMKLLIWEDGKTSVISQNSRPMEPSEKYISFPCWGRGNVDDSIYSEGWCEQEEDEHGHFTGSYINLETKEIMTAESMVIECIEEGDFSEYYEEWILEIERKFREDY